MAIHTTLVLHECPTLNAFALQVGGHLAFETATVDQHRNPHRLLLDFADELDLYSQAGQLVQYLLGWQPQTATLSEQMVELAYGMADKGFWKVRALIFASPTMRLI